MELMDPRKHAEQKEKGLSERSTAPGEEIFGGSQVPMRNMLVLFQVMLNPWQGPVGKPPRELGMALAGQFNPPLSCSVQTYYFIEVIDSYM